MSKNSIMECTEGKNAPYELLLGGCRQLSTMLSGTFVT